MEHTLRFSILINQPVSLVYSHLANPTNLLGLQPLLTSMSSIQETLVDQQRIFSYETIETFRLCGRRVLHNRIQVQTILTAPPQRLESYVRSVPNLHLAVQYNFATQHRGTMLHEQMVIKGPWWIMPFVIWQASQAQQQTLANLKARLEANRLVEHE